MLAKRVLAGFYRLLTSWNRFAEAVNLDGVTSPKIDRDIQSISQPPAPDVRQPNACT
ncbi:MAG: hypothetical protein NTU41_01970 [Chloroflexi bacterium]|nr:hypothetical protein [Chloroflexota bacterium]